MRHLEVIAMKKYMKKYIGITLALICILSLAACVSNKKIVLPEPENITEVEITEPSSSAVKKISDKEEISKLISEIKENTSAVAMESVNDQPTNVDSYITIKFYHKDAEGNPDVAYLYKEKGSSYVEQPYSGIWKLTDEVFDSVSNNL